MYLSGIPLPTTSMRVISAKSSLERLLNPSFSHTPANLNSSFRQSFDIYQGANQHGEHLCISWTADFSVKPKLTDIRGDTAQRQRQEEKPFHGERLRRRPGWIEYDW